MGYESKVYLVRECEHKGKIEWNEVIASVDMCCMNDEFVELFDQPCKGRISLYQHHDYEVQKADDGKYYVEAHDTFEDAYGKPPTQAPIGKVLKYLSSNEGDYWRTKFLRALAEQAMLDMAEYKSTLKFVHIGY